MLGGQTISSRIRIFNRGGEYIDVDCVLESDPTTNLEFSTAILIGTKDQYRWVNYTGLDIINFERLLEVNERYAERPRGLARLRERRWRGHGESEYSAKHQMFCKLEILRYDTHMYFDHERAFRYTYVFSTDISDWQAGTLFLRSFDGTITKEFNDSLVDQLYSDEAKTVCLDKNYYYKDSNAGLVQVPRCALVILSRSRIADPARIHDVCRLILQFVYGCYLWPLERNCFEDGHMRNTVWLQHVPDNEPLNFFRRPIAMCGQRAFISSSIKYLLKYKIDIVRLKDIVLKYVNSVNDTSVDRSFTLGCEAIEGLFGLIGVPNEVHSFG